MQRKPLSKKASWVIGLSVVIAAASFGAVPLLSIALLMVVCLFLVAAHDNDSGIYLMLSTLGIIVIVVNALLIFGLAYIHKVFSG